MHSAFPMSIIAMHVNCPISSHCNVQIHRINHWNLHIPNVNHCNVHELPNCQSLECACAPHQPLMCAHCLCQSLVCTQPMHWPLHAMENEMVKCDTCHACAHHLCTGVPTSSPHCATNCCPRWTLHLPQCQQCLPDTCQLRGQTSGNNLPQGTQLC